MDENYVAYEENAQTPVEAPAEKKSDFLKKNWKKLLIAAGALVCVIILLCVIIGSATNSFRTPMKNELKLFNKKSKDAMTDSLDMLNGFCEKDMKKAMKIIKKSEDMEDLFELYNEMAEESFENKQDEFGKNFKKTAKLSDKDKLDKDELKIYKKRIKEMGKDFLDTVEETEDYDREDWEDAADEMGLSVSQAKQLMRIMKKVGKTLKNAKVTAGYELEYDTKIKGKELDDPIENEEGLTVIKVNGRWINIEALSGMFNFF